MPSSVTGKRPAYVLDAAATLAGKTARFGMRRGNHSRAATEGERSVFSAVGLPAKLGCCAEERTGRRALVATDTMVAARGELFSQG